MGGGCGAVPWVSMICGGGFLAMRRGSCSDIGESSQLSLVRRTKKNSGYGMFENQQEMVFVTRLV